MSHLTRIEVDGRGVATLWLARPEKHNALSAHMMDHLRDDARRLGADPDVRVVVLAAEGGTFCAGGDLGWMQEQMAADAEARAREARRLAGMLMVLDRIPKPLIGRIHGNAFGGGVGLAAICDMAIGCETIKMGLTEVRLGLIPATIGPYVIARMGAARARQVFFSGRVFDAEEAARLGLLARVVSAADLDAAVEEEVVPYLSAAPGAVAQGKALLHELGGSAGASEIEASVNALGQAWAGPESAEGIAAFFDKRLPAWIK